MVFGLIFDVDGVIADTEGVNVRASVSMFEELFGLFGIEKRDFEAGLGRGAAEYVRAAARIHGLEMSEMEVQMATAMRQEKFLSILENEPLAAFEGVVELMKAGLGREDLKLAIATSGTREKSEAVLKSAKIPYQKMTYVTGSEVKNKKPDPELFLTAASKMGVEPEKCVVIEDAPDGVAAAKAAGCKCIAVTNSTTGEKLKDADMIVDSLCEIDIETVIKLVA